MPGILTDPGGGRRAPGAAAPPRADTAGPPVRGPARPARHPGCGGARVCGDGRKITTRPAHRVCGGVRQHPAEWHGTSPGAPGVRGDPGVRATRPAAPSGGTGVPDGEPGRARRPLEACGTRTVRHRVPRGAPVNPAPVRPRPPGRSGVPPGGPAARTRADRRPRPPGTEHRTDRASPGRYGGSPGSAGTARTRTTEEPLALRPPPAPPRVRPPPRQDPATPRTRTVAPRSRGIIPGHDDTAPEPGRGSLTWTPSSGSAP